MGEQLIAHIIICLNNVERKLKDIIVNYVDSPRDFFIRDVLLNNLVINFHTKYSILKFIAKQEGLTLSKDLDKGIKQISSIRNAVAHSDQLTNISIIASETHFDGGQTPVFGLDPDILIKENDEFVEVKLTTKQETFNKYYDIVMTELNTFEFKISSKS